MKATKPGYDVSVLRRGFGSPLLDLFVYSAAQSTQAAAGNPCAVRNGGCEELCFHAGDGTRTCACAHGRIAPGQSTRCQGLATTPAFDSAALSAVASSRCRFQNCFV